MTRVAGYGSVMTRVAGYGRVSTNKQVVDGTSLKYQEERVSYLCKAHDWSFNKFYSDPGISGRTIKKRKGLQKLLEDAKSGEFDTVAFTKLDRLGRNTRELLNIIELITKDYELDFICIDIPSLNTKDAYGKFALQIFSAMSELESSQIRERTGSGKFRKWKNMEAQIGQPPFGYRFNKNKKGYEFDSDNPEKIKTVKKIFDLYGYQHYSMNDIAIKLSDDNIPTPSSYRWKKNVASRWNVHTVRRILTEPAYKGKVIHNKYKHKESKYEKYYTYQSKEEKPKNEWITITFPILVPEDIWNRVQARIEQQKNKPKKKHRGFENRFLAENVIRCGECNGKMRKDLNIKPRKDGTAKLNYLCHWQNASQKVLRSKNRRKCILRRVDADLVDAIIFKHVANILSDPVRFAQEWFKSKNVQEIESEHECLKRDIKNKRKEIKRAISVIVKSKNHDIREMAEAELRESEAALEKTKTKLESINAKYKCIKNNVDVLAEFQEAVRNVYGYETEEVTNSYKTELIKYLYKLPFKEKKRIVEAVIAPEKGGSCKIRYPRPTDYLDHIDLQKLTEEEWEQDEPLLDKKPRIDMEFWVDFKSLAALIASLNKTELLDKFGR